MTPLDLGKVSRARLARAPATALPSLDPKTLKSKSQSSFIITAVVLGPRHLLASEAAPP